MTPSIHRQTFSRFSWVLWISCYRKKKSSFLVQLHVYDLLQLGKISLENAGYSSWLMNVSVLKTIGIKVHWMHLTSNLVLYDGVLSYISDKVNLGAIFPFLHNSFHYHISPSNTLCWVHDLSCHPLHPKNCINQVFSCLPTCLYTSLFYRFYIYLW